MTHLAKFIKKIVSGGQTGVDRAALDVAIKLGIFHGGWCPYGRQAEDGVISKKYNLKEAPLLTEEQNADFGTIYKIRTELNTMDSDGTLILINTDPADGTLYTIEMLKKHKKPYFIFNLSKNTNINDLANWIVKKKFAY